MIVLNGVQLRHVRGPVGYRKTLEGHIHARWPFADTVEDGRGLFDGILCPGVGRRKGDVRIPCRIPGPDESFEIIDHLSATQLRYRLMICLHGPVRPVPICNIPLGNEDHWSVVYP